MNRAFELRNDLHDLTLYAERVHHEGVDILRSHDPEHDAARWLLDHGIADPADMLQTWRGITPCMSGIVGHLAKRTVIESDKGGLQVRRWSDMQADRSRLATLPRRSRAEGGLPLSVSSWAAISCWGVHPVFPNTETPSLAPSHADLGAELPHAATQ